MGASAFVRRISSGIDVRDMLEKDSWLSRLGSGLFFAVLVTAMDVIGKREAMSFILESQVSGQNSIRNSRLCYPDRSVLKTTCSYQSENKQRSRQN